MFFSRELAEKYNIGTGPFQIGVKGSLGKNKKIRNVSWDTGFMRSRSQCKRHSRYHTCAWSVASAASRTCLRERKSNRKTTIRNEKLSIFNSFL